MNARAFSYRKSLFVLLILIVFISSCATISGRYQDQVFESKSGSVDIYDSEGILLGQTPFVHRIDRSANFSFQVEGGRQQVHSCDFVWGTLAGNGLASSVFYSVPPAVGISFVATSLIDLMSGSSYSCPDVMVNNLSYSKEKCKSIVMLPIDGENYRFEHKVYGAWQQKFSNNSSNDCDKIIDPKTTDDFFDRLKGGSVSEYDLNRRYKRELSSKYNATHAVQLQEVDQKGVKSYQAKIFQLAKSAKSKFAKLDPKFNLGLDLIGQDYVESRRWTNKAKAALITLIPNSLIFSFNSSNLNNNIDSSVELDISQLQESNQFISGWGVTSMDHPDAFLSWDHRLRFFPSLDYKIERFRVEIDEEVPGFSSEFDFSFVSIAAYYNLGYTVYTPFGGTRFELGTGASWFGVYGDESLKKNHFVTSFRGGLSHTVFLSDSLFLTAGGRFSAFSKKIIKNQIMDTDAIVSFRVGLGYYFPNLKSIASRAVL